MLRKLALLTAVSGLMLWTAQVNWAIPAPGEKTHSMKAEVVSVDTAGKKITIKDEKGETKTVPVLDSAAAMLKNFKAGDKVTLTCKDSDKGEHQGVSDIAKAT